MIGILRLPTATFIYLYRLHFNGSIHCSISGIVISHFTLTVALISALCWLSSDSHYKTLKTISRVLRLIGNPCVKLAGVCPVATSVNKMLNLELEIFF